jgi:hypothetical protein
MASTRRNELILRLLAGRCQTCEDTVNLEVYASASSPISASQAAGRNPPGCT